MVTTAIPVDEIDPAPRELLERIYLSRVDLIINDTGNHRGILKTWPAQTRCCCKDVAGMMNAPANGYKY